MPHSLTHLLTHSAKPFRFDSHSLSQEFLELVTLKRFEREDDKVEKLPAYLSLSLSAVGHIPVPFLPVRE